MSIYLDTSVLIAALVEDESHHEAFLRLLISGAGCTWSHSLAEAYATLTGGRLGVRVDPATADELLQISIAGQIELVDLPAPQVLSAIQQEPTPLSRACKYR